MHERSVDKQRYDAMQEKRTATYEAAKTADPVGVATYELRIAKRLAVSRV